jgi:hypothetical protein
MAQLAQALGEIAATEFFRALVYPADEVPLALQPIGVQ